MAKKKVKKAARKTAKKKTVAPKRSRKTMGLAIIALIINIFLFPGLGTLISGKKIKSGIWQIAIAIVGALLWGMFIGYPIFAVAWIWGIVSGIQLIQESKQ